MGDDGGSGDGTTVREALERLATLVGQAPDGLRGELEAVARTLGAAAEGAGGALGRFRDLGPLGSGAMGEVRRVFDPVLDRALALKVLPAGSGPVLERRFVEEARISAGLEHPAIVPIHELGTSPDGRAWFTMREVRGRTLAAVIAEGPSLRRLLDLLRRVAEAVAYAHARGVVHRDLKPTNVMVGGFGEVFVLDWGIAKVVGRDEAPATGGPAGGDAAMTLDGTVMGTPAYMSPEQAEGDPARIGPATDVWALGAMLYEVLAGRRPIEGDVFTVMARLSDPDLVVHRVPSRAPLDHPLWEVCERCLARDPRARPADAGAVAAALGAWLDGERSRERALGILAGAVGRWPEADALRARATSARAEGAQRLAALPPWAPEEDRWAAWALEDEARALEVRAALAEVAAEQAAGAALAELPSLPEAHAALASRYRRAAAEALDLDDPSAAARAEALLERHARALPAEHPDRSAHLAWLEGSAELVVETDPPSGVVVERYVEEHRRLHARPEQAWPSSAAPRPLAAGSWRLRLVAPGRPEVLFPVAIGRGERRVVRLALPASVPEGAVYVPPGPFVAGGEKLRPRRALWCDGFVIGRFPVTLAEYVVFLNDLLARGREEEALACAPQAPLGRYGPGPLMLPREPDGRFRTGLDPDGDLLADDLPAMGVAWSGAVAYARWLRDRTGLPWRLPGELEWEKAARGVDGRTHPWGRQADPSRTNCRDSREGRSMAVGVDTFPIDESPYGLRGAAGNVRDWTADAWSDVWAPLDGDRVIPPPLDPPEPARVVGRGGGWPLWAGGCDALARTEDRTDYRHPAVGFRVACSWPWPDPGRRGSP